MAARTKASQGERRLIALLLKEAGAGVIKESKDEEPIIIMDDVLSELDAGNRKRLRKILKKSRQTLLTTTEAESIEESLLSTARIIHLDKD